MTNPDIRANITMVVAAELEKRRSEAVNTLWVFIDCAPTTTIGPSKQQAHLALQELAELSRLSS